MVLVQNEYFSITEKDEKLLIHTFSPGFSIRDFQAIIEKYPRIAISNFLMLKKALEQPTNGAVEFGRLKPKLDLNVTPDNLEGKIYINLTKEEFEANKVGVINEVLKILEDKKITYGILYDVINKELEVQKDIVVARGKLPAPGTDASVIYLELPEMKPTIREDGSTDYYEMNLFRYVKKGDWLGEKVLPGPGEPGMNIKGEVLPPKSGKDKNLRFDANSVDSVTEGDRVLMRAKFDGALQVKEGKIGVVDHLIIHTDVSYETGNINFQGYVTIHGIVEDGFSVTADKDISILGDMGIGAVEKIVSRKGNIYIKGGVSGKGKAVIEAGQSVFVKYANACIIKAQDSISIGYYALDSYLEADSILVEAKNGRTIGGNIQAKSKVLLRTVGNVYEKKTSIQVQGFDRKAVKKELDDLLVAYKQLLEEAERNDRELKIYETTLTNSGEIKSTEDYIRYHKAHEDILDQIYVLEEQRKNLTRVLSSKGEGEVSIYEKAYPQTFLQIKNIQKRIKEITSGSFYAVDNKLMFD
ncbi:MAG: DUF342 domain-containing protein [Bacillota bacterium]